MVTDVRDVESFVRHVHADRVSKDVRVLSIGWQPGSRSVAAKEMIDEPSRERRAPELPTAEEVRAGIVSAYPEVPSEKRQTAREELIRLRDSALQPPYEDPPVPHSLNREKGNLAATEPMQVHEVEEEPIAEVLPRNRAEEARDFVLRQVLHDALSRPTHPELIPS